MYQLNVVFLLPLFIFGDAYCRPMFFSPINEGNDDDLRCLSRSNIKIRVGRGGALVESMTFNRRVVGSTPALAAMSGLWASPLPTVVCALWRETPIQYSCCSRERL